MLRKRQPQQCWVGSIHNSASFLLLHLASCYAKIEVGGGAWSVETDRDMHPQEATGLSIPKKCQAPKCVHQSSGPEKVALAERIWRRRRPCKPKKQEADSFPPLPRLHPPSLSLFLSPSHWHPHLALVLLSLSFILLVRPHFKPLPAKDSDLG